MIELSPDVERMLGLAVSLAEREEARKLLLSYGSQTWHSEPNRVRLAILKNSKGTLAGIHHELELANRDFRDVLVCAEFPEEFQVLKPTPEMRARDRAQYLKWLEGPRDVLETKLQRTYEVLNEGFAAGLHIGAQLFVAIDGQSISDLALGRARLATDSAPEIPMQTDTLMLWLSAGKPLTAIAIAMLIEKNILALDARAADYWPDFAQNGKDAITLRHLLTHTAGIRGLDTAYPFATWDETLQRIAESKLERDWIPGQKAGYHTHTSWYVLGEIIRRATGIPCDQWLRTNIFEPLKMLDTHLAMTPEQYTAYGSRIGYLYDTTISPPKPLPNYDTQLAATRPRPSASARGPIRELARFYQMLQNGGELDGVRLLQNETVQQITARQRINMLDQTFRQKIDWGLGIIINSSHYGPGIPYQFGPYASPNTFGHGGSQSSTAFADPQNHLVVSLIFNGCPGEAAHDKRLRATLKALYEDLQIAT